MTPLGDVRWIFVHTVGVPGDSTMKAIRRFHVLERGWSDVGYHFGIRKDGELETGRDIDYAGAHVRGVNSRSIGVCVYGDGDTEPHTEAQRIMLLNVLRSMMKSYNVPVERVLGHREINDLIDAGEVGEKYRTPKTCPGRLVDMDEIRAELAIPHALPEPVVEAEDSIVDGRGIR